MQRAIKGRQAMITATAVIALTLGGCFEQPKTPAGSGTGSGTGGTGGTGTGGTTTPPAKGFAGYARVEFLFGKDAPLGREVRLVDDFTFVDSKGNAWTAPKGFVTDGATIPGAAWSGVGGPLDGPYRDAAILHDRYCSTKERTADETHNMFHEAAIARGTDAVTAGTMYAAILIGGPTWSAKATKKGSLQMRVVPASMLPLLQSGPIGGAPKMTPEQIRQFLEMKSWIEREKPSKEAIARMVEEIKRGGTVPGAPPAPKSTTPAPAAPSPAPSSPPK